MKSVVFIDKECVRVEDLTDQDTIVAVNNAHNDEFYMLISLSIGDTIYLRWIDPLRPLSFDTAGLNIETGKGAFFKCRETAIHYAMKYNYNIFKMESIIELVKFINNLPK